MREQSTRVIFCVLLLSPTLPLALSADEASPGAKPTPLELFEQRIMPIFKSPQPSSCVQCHLAGVDLKDYILPSQEATFVSLREQGLIDMEKPEKSKILELIRMGEKDLDEGAKRIHEKTRKAERAAFAAWIEACCADPALRDLSATGDAKKAGPKRDDAVIRHARKSRVVDSFARTVWSQRMRCFPCHTPHEIDETNPKHRRPAERVKDYELQLGKEIAERLRIFKRTPEETLRGLIETSRKTPAGQLPLINIAEPRKSLLLLKPTAKLPPKIDGERAKPSYVEPVSHLGGLKMHVDDQSYKAFVAWLEDYAKVVGDSYSDVDDLPADNWYASKHVLMIEETPEAWPALARVQLFVHAWDREEDAWSAEPVAFTQGSVTPRRRLVGALFLLRPHGSTHDEDWKPEDSRLASGHYLLKAFLDSKQRLAEDPTLFLGEEELSGQAEIRAHWGQGFKEATRIPGRRLK